MVFKFLEKRVLSHEQVVFCSCSKTRLKAIIAIHSTFLGPSLGGCRMYSYNTEEQALEDVLNLSEAMSYKAAIANLPLGGGKSVIIGDPKQHKNPDLLRAFGRHVDFLKGRYFVAKDMGITKEDLMYIGETSSYVLGRPVKRGGVGDPSPSTAKGVYLGIKEAVKWKMKKNSLKGIRILVQGLGAVGRHLVDFLFKDGAEVYVFDINKSCMDELCLRYPKLKSLSEEEVYRFPCEVFSPCSVGQVLNDKTVETLRCSIIAGGANNQLSSVSIAKKIKKKNILYIPDFVINSGGLIYVSSYVEPKKSIEWVERKINKIPEIINELLESSSKENTEPYQTALNIAKAKIEKPM